MTNVLFVGLIRFNCASLDFCMQVIPRSLADVDQHQPTDKLTIQNQQALFYKFGRSYYSEIGC